MITEQQRAERLQRREREKEYNEVALENATGLGKQAIEARIKALDVLMDAIKAGMEKEEIPPILTAETLIDANAIREKAKGKKPAAKGRKRKQSKALFESNEAQ